jgi:hypothetical protein
VGRHRLSEGHWIQGDGASGGERSSIFGVKDMTFKESWLRGLYHADATPIPNCHVASEIGTCPCSRPRPQRISIRTFVDEYATKDRPAIREVERE